MKRPDWQLSRNGLFWVLLAFAAVIALHLDHLPAWITALVVACIAWRILEYRGVVPFPSWPLKVLFVGATVAGLTLTYPSLRGLEPMVSMLLAGFGLKLLEMRHKRDAVVLVYLAFFAAAIDLVFRQDVTDFILVAAVYLVATTALVSINQSKAQGFTLGSSKTALKMLAASVPLMLVLFLVVPRLGAFWSIPGPKNQARTGVSDSLAPGEFTSLVGSDEVAFRVRFEGDVPPRNRLYWRGLVFSEFDGRSWSQADFFGPDRPVLERRGDDGIERLGEPLRYTVTMEPTHQRWLFALSTPATSETGVRRIRDSRLVSSDRIGLRREGEAPRYVLSGSIDTDKKHSAMNLLRGRGKRVVAEAAIPAASAHSSTTRPSRFARRVDEAGEYDIHVHVPEGATPKDGPSAGVGMCTALVSALTRIPVRADVAMTGEITLRGEVLPIGGLKEKLLAAHRGGITTVLIPEENRKDLAEIPKNVKDKLDIRPVKWIDEVLQVALQHPPVPVTDKGAAKPEEKVKEKSKPGSKSKSVRTH